MKLKYVIRFVADMSSATAFFRDTLGLKVEFQSPHWTEFDTGSTTLALHPATPEHAAGTYQMGFNVDDLEALYAARASTGLKFGAPPSVQRGVNLASILDCDGVESRVSG